MKEFFILHSSSFILHPFRTAGHASRIDRKISHWLGRTLEDLPKLGDVWNA
jgi:hypothetical protein